MHVFDMSIEQDMGIAAAEVAVRRGELVVLPTDTVYGVGCDAFSAAAVTRLLAAKGRGRDMPVPVLIADTSVLSVLAEDVPEGAWQLAQHMWPGGLTLIVTARQSLNLDLGDANGTIAVRVPDHACALALLQRTGPLAVSSANTTGLPPATDCAEAQTMLDAAVSVYLDAGPTPGSAPSTIVDFVSSRQGRIVRLGQQSQAAIRAHRPSLES